MNISVDKQNSSIDVPATTLTTFTDVNDIIRKTY